MPTSFALVIFSLMHAWVHKTDLEIDVRYLRWNQDGRDVTCFMGTPKNAKPATSIKLFVGQSNKFEAMATTNDESFGVSGEINRRELMTARVQVFVSRTVPSKTVPQIPCITSVSTIIELPYGRPFCVGGVVTKREMDVTTERIAEGCEIIVRRRLPKPR